MVTLNVMFYISTSHLSKRQMSDLALVYIHMIYLSRPVKINLFKSNTIHMKQEQHIYSIKQIKLKDKITLAR